MKHITALTLAAAFLLFNFSFAQTKIVSPKYKKYKTEKGSWYPDKVYYATDVTIVIDKDTIECEFVDPDTWTLKGAGAEGSATLNRSDEEGIWWSLSFGNDKVRVQISSSEDGTNDPRDMYIISGQDTMYMYNYEPDANSAWGLSIGGVDRSWEAKIVLDGNSNWEYKDEQERTLDNGEKMKVKWDETPEWRFKGKWKKVDGKFQFAFIWASIMAQNVRYNKDIVR